MALTGKRHPFLARYTAAYDERGVLRGFDVAMYSDGGWCLDLSEPVLWRAIFHLDNAYLLPAVDPRAAVHREARPAVAGPALVPPPSPSPEAPSPSEYSLAPEFWRRILVVLALIAAVFGILYLLTQGAPG